MFPEIARDDIFRLETERLWLRWPRAGDAEAIAHYLSDPEVGLETAEIPHPYRLSDAERFVRETRERNSAGTGLHLALALKRRQNEPIGMVSAWDAGERRCLAIGYWLGRPHWGQGLMTEAVLAFLDLIFKITTIDYIVSSAMTSNARSLRLQEKLGFARIGEGLSEAPAREGGNAAVVKTMLKRGMAHTAFGARRPKLLSS